MAGSLSQQLRWLIYRNFLLKYRNRRQTLQEVLFPLYFILMLGAFILPNQPKTYPAISSFPSHNLSMFTNPSLCSGGLAVTPNTSKAQDVVENVTSLLGLTEPYRVYDSEQEMVDAHFNNTISCGVVFNGDVDDMNYTIRTAYWALPDMQTDFTGVDQCRDNADGLSTTSCSANQYLNTGFAALQTAIDQVLIAVSILHTNGPLPTPQLFVQMLAKDSYRSSTTLFQTLVGIYLILAFSPFIAFLLVNLVTEKEKKIKEGMKMMGMRDLAFWLSWSIIYVAMLFVICIACTLLAWAMRIFPSSNPFLIFLVFFLYGLSMVCAGFMLTPFFNKALVAGAVGSLTSIVVSLLYLPLVLTSSIPIAVQWIMCLLSPLAMALACNQATLLETSYGNRGVQFDNMWVGDFPFAGCLIMLAVDIVLYLLLAIYFEQVVPGAYGQRKPLLFCFMPSFWKSKTRVSDKAERNEGTPILSSHVNINVNGSAADIEPVSSELKSRDGIRITNLLKAFPPEKRGGKPVVAVNGITLDIYEGEITCLLGHNGAGKTTLIGALSGMVPPTSGGATIYGMDVTDPNAMGHIRTITGVCPQQDIVFDQLTAREHLKVYAGIKGIPEEDIDAKVDKILNDVDLHKNAETNAGKLSGGQKRKLCVGMALIGDPKVLFLDEPSSGMDPYSRRHLWSLLKNNRKGRVTVLTTHFMDEADILADRKAIISKGTLRCYGSSLFLKNKFGIGYHLGMVIEQGTNTDAVTEFVKSHLESAELGRSYGMELTYTLPLEDVNLFVDLFHALESTSGESAGVTKAKSLGIQTYGVSMTTLEEVFLKLGEEQEQEESVEGDAGQTESTNLLPGKDNLGASFKSLSVTVAENGAADDQEVEFKSTALHSSQISSRKVEPGNYQFTSFSKIILLQALRNPATYIVRIILPTVFMVIGIVLIRIQVGSDDKLDPTMRTHEPSAYLALNTDTVTTKKTMFLYENSTGGEISSLLTQFDNMNIQYAAANLTNMLDKEEAHNLAVGVQEWQSTGTGILANLVAMYNDTAQHAIPVILNILDNAIYGELSGDTATITTSSQAFPVKENSITFTMGIFFIMFYAIALIGVAPGFAVDLVKDREIKTKAQLRISGLRTFSYWLSHFVIDVIQYCVPAIIGVILILAFQVESYKQPGALVCVIILLIIFVPSNTIFIFCNSFLFDKFETCQTVFPWITNLSFYIFGIPVIVLDLVGQPEAAVALNLVFCVIFPTHGIVGGLYYIDRVYQTYALANGPGDVPFEEYFKMDSYIIPTFITMIVGFTLYILLLKYLDARTTGTPLSESFKCCKSTLAADQQNPDISVDEDDDVRNEREKVDNMTDISSMEKPPSVVVKGIRKSFNGAGKSKKRGTGKKNYKDGEQDENIKVAVRNLSLAIERGEVFGLLGPNGAGKTTSMNIITADVAADCGKVTIGGHDVNSPVSDAFLLMGYCPQINPLWDDITTREHIEVYAAIKGIHPKDRKEISDYFLNALKMQEHADKRAKNLSGGTKRKLCFLISMLGEPGIVLLDEPSTGLDPGAKRFLWDTITASFVGERGAILTTHSMEEADAVCSRVGIMTLGQLRCVGSTQHLKDKYGGGYVLEVKLKVAAGSDDAAEETELAEKVRVLQEFVMELFPPAQVMEKFNERILYKIPQDDVSSLAAVFSALEKGKASLGIEEYSFSQSTLEQVFLGFAKAQEEEDGLDAADRANLTRQKSMKENADVAATADPSPC
ncbi:cholesterol transporter ABCA5-like [Glandiceps talaboti]